MGRVGTTALAVAVLPVVSVSTATSASSQTKTPSIPQPTNTPTAQPGPPPAPPVPDALPRSELDPDRSRDCIRILPDDEDGFGAEPFACEQLPPKWWDTPIQPLEPYRGTRRFELLVDPAPS